MDAKRSIIRKKRSSRANARAASCSQESKDSLNPAAGFNVSLTSYD
ncbi:hypothetical protein HMPREF9412_3389 [Paenibacillus sp. HGF5]|nr:hypothetical protein HMPREF9412_3389 [Paenibacillus sp. HGF5]